jgi:hypothetical protein
MATNDKLCSDLHLHFASEPERLELRSDLCGVRLVPSRMKTLNADVAALGLTWKDLGHGNWQLEGGAFALYVVEIDTVAEAEGDDLLRLFGHAEARTVEARRWLSQQLGAEEVADFSKASPNPYARRLKKQVTIRLDEDTIN